MRNIPTKLLSVPVLISLGNSSGSGVLYATDKYMYLITARHVLYDELQNIRVDSIEIVCQSTDINDDSTTRLRLDLNLLTSKFHRVADVCVVKLAEITSLSPTIKSKYLLGVEILEKASTAIGISKRKDVLLINDILIPNDIYIFGYPTSIGLRRSPQFDYNKPLIRKGIVSNIYKETKTIVLDAAVYNGNSGGPIVQVKIKQDGKREFNLIGIVSEYIPYVKNWKNQRNHLENIVEYINSGYSVASSMDNVLELIQSCE